MAPSSKSERGGPGGKRGPGGAAGGSAASAGSRGRRDHVVKQLERVKLSGQLSPRLFRKLPVHVCVSLKSIVDEDLLYAGHIFLGFSKCGRYVLSYTSSGGDDDFSFYVYHLYWWQFNVHSKLRLVRKVRLFQGEEIYSDLFLTVCEWPSDASKVIVFGFNTRSANGLLLNMMLSDENHRDIYISAIAVPPARHCPACHAALAQPGAGQGHCLRHGFLLHTKYQVVYPFPTFQPAFQLKKDQVVLLNTSYSLVACAVAVHAAGDSGSCQILYERRGMGPGRRGGAAGLGGGVGAFGDPPRTEEAEGGGSGPQPSVEGGEGPGGRGQSPAVAKAKEFVADIFRRAKEATGGGGGGGGAGGWGGGGVGGGDNDGTATPPHPPSHTPPPPGSSRCRLHPPGDGHDPPTPDPPDPEPPDPSPSPSPSPSSSSSGPPPPEPGYVNYTKLRYVLEPADPDAPQEEFEDDKISLPFVVTDLGGRRLRPLRHRALAPGQYLTVEQLTLDFEYVINEVIRNDAAWARQFCSFSDYDIVILEVCPETNQVIINIGLLLLAFPSPDQQGQLRPRPYHTSLQVAWDLNSGTFATVGVGELAELKGQTSGSVWSWYRKGCVDTVMRWLVPESSGRNVNRMTNEALHKGCSLKVLADNERYTWIVL